MAGHPTSEATKQKLSAIQKGRVNIGKHNSPTTEFKKGQHFSPNTEIKKGNQLHRGYHVPDHIKQRFSDYHKNNRIITRCETCNKEISLIKYNAINQNHHFCSNTCKHSYFSGARNNKWNGGVTPYNKLIRDSDEYLRWRNDIFVRDDYTCQTCKVRGGELQAHHKQPFSTHSLFRLTLENGITLCKKCHNYLHTYITPRRDKKGRFAKVIQYCMF